MNIRQLPLLTILFGLISIHGAESITGRVINSSNTALDSAKVWLASDPTFYVYTDTDGKFSLPIPTTGNEFHHTSKENARLFNFQNNQFEFFLNVPQQISVELLNVQGVKVATVFRGMGVQGINSFALKPYALHLSSGFYILKYSGTQEEFKTQLILADDVLPAHFRTMNAARGFKKVAVSDAEDSLIVLRMGYEIKKTPLANVTSQDVDDISLSLRSYRVEATVNVKPGRTIEVILPSDYDDLYALPVLYLLHGGGEDHATWRIKANLIDNLNNFSGKESMQAMIIVTPDAASQTGYGDYGKTGDAFYTDLTEDIRESVESQYKVNTDRTARAISGFSMGAMQTHNLTLFYPDLFGYALPICGGLYRCAGFSESKMRADIASGTIDTAAVNSMKIYRLHSNPTDIAWGDTQDFEKFLGTVGIKHTYDFTSYSIGGHTYEYNMGVFQKYVLTLFK